MWCCRRARARADSGAALFAEKLRHTLKSDMTPADVETRAHREYAAVRAEMIRLARDIWPTWLPDRPRPAAASTDPAAVEIADRETVRAVLDAIATDHPRRRRHPPVLPRRARCASRTSAATATSSACADEPLEIRWTPVFMRAFGGAMLDSPGPLDKGQKAFFCVTPIPEDWTPSRPSPTCARTTTGCSACSPSTRPCPATTSRASTPTAARRSSRAVFCERRLRRGLGRLRDPGDDGPGLRRRRPGAAADPLEVLPARRDQRHHRRRHPRRRT